MKPEPQYPECPKDEPPYRMTIPVVSAMHVQHLDLQSLSDHRPHEVYAHGSEGYWQMVHLGDPDEQHTVEDYEDYFQPSRYTDEFRELLVFFSRLGYTVIRIDGDCGDVITGLPTFDW